MDDTLLLAAICNDRGAYETAKRIGVDSRTFGEAGGCIYNAVEEQYGRDSSLSKVDKVLLRTQIERRFGKTSLASGVVDLLGTLPGDTSTVNVIEEYRLHTLAAVSMELAGSLAAGRHNDGTDELIKRYREIRQSASAGAALKHRLDSSDFADDKAGRMPLAPKRLNDYIGGGIKRGHSILIFGRPESAKTLLALNATAYLVAKGYKVLYVANEEPGQDITRRLLSRLLQRNVDRIEGEESIAQAIAECADAYDRFFLMHKGHCTIEDIRARLELVRPDVLVLDQIRNVYSAEDNRALQLDAIARRVRELASEYNCAVISLTQAGDSAHNKLVLEQNDVDWSNTGIPGATDIMIGVGVNPEYEMQDKRLLTLCKNKANGQHGSLPIWVNKRQSLALSTPRAN